MYIIYTIYWQLCCPFANSLPRSGHGFFYLFGSVPCSTEAEITQYFQLLPVDGALQYCQID